MKILATIGLLGLLGMASACGSDPAAAPGANGSCKQASNTCYEYGGLNAAQDAAEKSACTGGSTWSDSACSHTNAVGGCKQTTAGIAVVVWYYSPTFTAASVMTACQSAGTFVTP